MKRYTRWMLLIFTILVSLFIGCSDDKKSNPRKFLATQNPGDVWEWTLTDTTFNATNEETGYNYTR